MRVRAAGVGLLALLLATVAGQAADKLVFNRDIRPILSDNCFLCHGRDAKRRYAGLRLDDREVALKTRAIVPGDPAKSKLVARINAKDPDDLMPPVDSHHPLTAAQKATLTQWILEGAEYQPHWSFIAPVKTPVPTVADPLWSRNPVDGFIAARLAKQGLQPSPPASKEVQLRRVSFDLTGLPPTPEELDAFVADTAPDAYERAVDRLLASPRYGEHLAIGWLDAARYADTHGMHFDNERHMWLYRDWVVKAFNDNLPYDKFLAWQLAGDQLPDATREQRTATGFVRCSPTSNEGGSIGEELLFRYAVDRTETTAGAMLGLTAGCAVCHDHKFDPLSQREFYQLYAFFHQAADPAFDGNALRTPPVLRLPTAEQEAKLAALDKDLSTSREELKQRVAKLDYVDPATLNPPPPVQAIEDVWVDDNFPKGVKIGFDGQPAQFTTAKDGPVKSGERALKRSGEGVIQDYFDGYKPGFRTPLQGTLFAHVYLDPKNPPKAVMLQFHAGDWKYRANWGDADAIPFGAKGTVAKLQAGPLPKTGEWVRLEFKVADFHPPAGEKFDGVAFTQFGGTVWWDLAGIRYEASPASDPELSESAWERLYNGKDPGAMFPQNIRNIFKLAPDKRNDGQRKALREHYLLTVHAPTRELLRPLETHVASLDNERKAIDEAIPATLVMADVPTRRVTHIMLRGQYDKPGEVVEPGTPAILPPLKAEHTPANRLDLANWMVAPENPLVARVAVNRLWLQVFGTGLVKTAGDFGSQGDPPSHPELLDWLAVDLREHGWDLKRLMKLLVTSAAYRQDSRTTQAVRDVDPENRLLARGPRFRLSAEELRDTALYVGGLLDPTLGGRGVRPYQPVNIWEPLAYPGSNTDRYVQDHGSALYRRSLYTFWKRTAPHPAMTALDSPSREMTCLRRERNNTPLQALVLMNDVQHVEAQRKLAERLLALPVERRLPYGFQATTGRRPTAREVQVLNTALDRQLAHFKAAPDAAKQLLAFGESPVAKDADAPTLAAYTLVANILLNLDEAVTKN